MALISAIIHVLGLCSELICFKQSIKKVPIARRLFACRPVKLAIVLAKPKTKCNTKDTYSYVSYKKEDKSEDKIFFAWFQGTGLSACSNILVLCSILISEKLTYWSRIAF